MGTWGSVAEVKASAQMKLSLTEYFSAAASRFGQDHLLMGYKPPATPQPPVAPITADTLKRRRQKRESVRIKGIWQSKWADTRNMSS